MNLHPKVAAAGTVGVVATMIVTIAALFGVTLPPRSSPPPSPSPHSPQATSAPPSPPSMAKEPVIIPVSKKDQTEALLEAARRLNLPMPTPGQRKTLAGS